MKKFFNYILCASLAAVIIPSCVKEAVDDSVKTPTVEKNSVISFKAYQNPVVTKASLTPNAGDTEFTASWTDGDEMVLNANSAAESFNHDATSTWDASEEEFDADFGEAVLPEGTSDWVYKAWYPAKNNIAFADRVQNGNSFNSAFDVMYGTLNVSNAKIGKDAGDNPIAVRMNRLTAIAYFHITGGPDEDVIGATLTANENLAAEKLAIASGGASVTPTNEKNTITMTFSTAPKATDIKLWFNVLPGDYTGLKLTIYTATKSASISASAISFTAGKLSKVVKNVGTWNSQIYYNKVISTENLSEQDYLIVYEPDKVVFDGSLATLDAGHNIITVPVLGSYIPITPASEASSFHIKPETNPNYSIRAASGKYIGRADDSNGMDTDVNALNNTITFDAGNAVITAAGGKVLQFNSSSGAANYRFRYYGSGAQKSISLFKSADNRTVQTLSFPQASYNASYPGTFDKPALSGANTTVTYSSSNTSVATVNSSNGNITLAGIGSTTITASAAADETYKAGTASYTLVVTDASINDIATLKNNLTGSSNSFTITLTDAIVTGKNGNNAYLEDATAGIYMYNCASALAVGDKFSGDVTVSAFVTNRNVPEITAFDASGATKTTGAVLPLTTKTLAEVLADLDDLDGMRIKVEGVQLQANLTGSGNAMVARGGSEIMVYSRDGDVDLSKYDVVDLIGYPQNYNGDTPEIILFDDADVDVLSLTWNLKSIAVTTPPSKTSYVAGETFSTAGMVVSGTYEDSTKEYTKLVDVTSSCIFTPSTSTALTTENSSITITYGGKSTSQAITVAAGGNTWARVTSVEQITAGGTFIIGYEATANSGILVPMRQEGTATTSANGYIRSGDTAGASNSNTITMSATMSSASTEAYETVIETGPSSGTVSIKIGDNYILDTASYGTKWSHQNKLSATKVDGTGFTPTMGTNNVVTFTSTREVNSTTYPALQYNSSSPRFTCYGSTQKKVVLYKKVVD